MLLRLFGGSLPRALLPGLQDIGLLETLPIECRRVDCLTGGNKAGAYCCFAPTPRTAPVRATRAAVMLRMWCWQA